MRSTLKLSAIALGVLGACSGPVPESSPDAGPLSVRIGAVHGDTFVALQDDDPCEIVNATQGGFWFMPVVSVDGLDPAGDSAQVECSLFDTVKNKQLASANGEYRFYDYDFELRTNLIMRLADLNLQNLPFYDGDRSIVTCTVSKGGQQAEEVLTVLIDVPGDTAVVARPVLDAIR